VVDSVVVSLVVDSEELLELLVASEELLEEEEEELLLELEELLEELEELLEAVVLSVSLLSQPTKARTVKSIATTIMRAKNFFMIKVLLL
jgi:hypothetical protein